MQIKKQLKVELNQTDVTEAIRDYLLKHNQKVSEDELSEIRYVNSVRDGIRATLNITEETDTETETPVKPVVSPTPVAAVEEEVVVEPEPEVVPETEAEPTTTIEPETDEDLGAVEPSAVEDVMPSIDDIATLAGEEESTTTVEPTERKSLFK